MKSYHNLQLLRKNCGIVPQEVFLFSDTIYNNIAFGGQEKLVTQSEVELAAKQAGVYDNIVSFPEQFETIVGERGVTLSGGQKQRFSIATTLINKPKIIFLDEPTTGLDPMSRLTLWEEVKRLNNEGTTVLLTTQYLEEADQLAHDIVVIDHGRAIARGTSQELKRRIGGEHLDIHLALLTDISRVEAIVRPFAIGAVRTDDQEVLVSIPVSKGIEALGSVMAELTAQNIEIVDIGLRRPTLDDVFMELTGHKTQEEQS